VWDFATAANGKRLDEEQGTTRMTSAEPDDQTYCTRPSERQRDGGFAIATDARCVCCSASWSVHPMLVRTARRPADPVVGLYDAPLRLQWGAGLLFSSFSPSPLSLAAMLSRHALFPRPRSCDRTTAAALAMPSRRQCRSSRCRQPRSRSCRLSRNGSRTTSRNPCLGL
jgi:hypothetical protein